MIRAALATLALAGCLSAQSYPDDPMPDGAPDVKARRGTPACSYPGEGALTVVSACAPADGGPWFAAMTSDTGEACALCALEFTAVRPDGCSVETSATFAIEGKVLCVTDCGGCH